MYGRRVSNDHYFRVGSEVLALKYNIKWLLIIILSFFANHEWQNKPKYKILQY